MGRVRWDADGLRDIVRQYVVENLATQDSDSSYSSRAACSDRSFSAGVRVRFRSIAHVITAMSRIGPTTVIKPQSEPRRSCRRSNAARTISRRNTKPLCRIANSLLRHAPPLSKLISRFARAMIAPASSNTLWRRDDGDTARHRTARHDHAAVVPYMYCWGIFGGIFD